MKTLRFFFLRALLYMVVIFTTFTPFLSDAQSVGVGTNTPNANAILDVNSTNKGLLIPRVALSATTSASPLGGFVAGMMVYNTATAGTSPNNVTPGFYLCSGTKWEKVGAAGWSLSGNSGTNPTTHFIGTTDDQDLVFKRNNIKAGALNFNLSNTSFGIYSLNNITSGSGNSAFGRSVLEGNQTGVGNCGFGAQVLFSNNSGSYNCSFGDSAMLLNVSGGDNVAIGTSTLGYNAAGNGGIAIGSWALHHANNSIVPFTNTNIAIGAWALAGSSTPANNTGLSNNVLGYFSMRNNSTGSRNNALGTKTLHNNTSGSGNVAVGDGSLFHNTLNDGNTAIGDSTLHKNGLGAVSGFQASNNTAIGNKSLISNTLGAANIAIGALSLKNNTIGNINIAIGYNSLSSTVGGDASIAIGHNTLLSNVAGIGGLAIGNGSMYNANNTQTPFENTNIAIGSFALQGSPVPANNTGLSNNVIGNSSMLNNSTGSRNNTLGSETLYNNTSGTANVAIGFRSLYYNTNKSDLIAIGDSTLYNNGVGASLANDATGNTAVGSKSLKENTIGWWNTALGSKSLYKNTSGVFNTAVGYNALYSNSVGAANAAFGSETLRNNNGNANSAFGVQALSSNTTGESNIAVGWRAGTNNTTGKNNVFLGTAAAYNNTDKSDLVAVGDSALFNNGLFSISSNDASFNTAIGKKSLFANTTGSQNTSCGYFALSGNSAGFDNTALGYKTLLSNTLGQYNTALGSQSLFNNSIGSKNVALGWLAGFNTTTGSNNIFIGSGAGFYETGSNKLYIHNSAATSNNALIYGEFDVNPQNQLLQINGKIISNVPAGQTGLDLASADAYAEMRVIRNTLNGTDNDLYLGFNSPTTSSVQLFSGGLTPVGWIKDNMAGIGKSPLPGNANSRLQIKEVGVQNGLGIESASSSSHWDFDVEEGSGHHLDLFYNANYKGGFSSVDGAYIMASDRRLKKDIVPLNDVMAKLRQLQTYQYHYLDNSSDSPLSSGFLAQDVQNIFPDAVNEFTTKTGETLLGINYQYFTVVAIKALQEQQLTVENQHLKVKNLEDEMEIEKSKVKNLEEKMASLEEKLNKILEQK